MKLSINIDHIATLRNARGGSVPDPVTAALAAERAGADGIVCHLREDRRHIRDHDVKALRRSVRTKLDLEMAATEDIVAIACRIRPDLVTLVPERRRELTTEGGLNVIGNLASLTLSIRRLHARGIEVSLFIDPVKGQIEAAKRSGADTIEIHTGEYANASTPAGRKKHLARIARMARFARERGLNVNAGHGLDYGNIRPVARISDIQEVSIGHAVIVRALGVGLENAVREMVELTRRR